MDLNVVEKRLKNGDYSSSQEFVLDIRRIWEKSIKFRKESSEI